MQPGILKDPTAKASWSVLHPARVKGNESRLTVGLLKSFRSATENG
jgi:hypothetical protein